MPDDNPPAIVSRWITRGAIRYHYRVAGPDDAPELPLILVHGLGVSSAYWRRIQPLLAAHRRVYALDLPGFGRTTHPRHLLNTVALAHTLQDWLAALGLTKVDLLGHSMGGPVVAEFAREHPDRVCRLMMVGATIGTRGAKAPRQTIGLLRDAFHESPSLLGVILRDYWRAGPRRVIGTDLLVDDDDTVATVGQLSLPLLVVRGNHDSVVPLSDTHLLLRGARGASFVAVDDAAHAVQWGRPRALARVVEAFMAGHGPDCPRDPH